ncbi:MAG: response regulator [Lachnospiraceae bacterium]|nr:response regulator [Lachnospiraceae bacterium]MBR5177453.1 response regulator [Lachnospiraceae bacterium]
MYRVMLIDDEESARKLMKASIKWESLDMEVVGEAASGIEAINVIDDMKPDIAFVDISMPFMNGIEFTEIATNRYPDLVIIIMTAFDEFEYARKCVSLPVFDYMLKPMVRSEVTEVLTKVKKRLDERSEKDEADNEPSGDLGSSSIDQIKKYIENNYTDSKLNLTSVAQNFGFSASYLSRKFKQETGKNFVEFLTECRMNAAMKLALTNMKMFNASNEVGIPDPNYFGRCFKKFAGMSYSEYVASKHTS